MNALKGDQRNALYGVGMMGDIPLSEGTNERTGEMLRKYFSDVVSGKYAKEGLDRFSNSLNRIAQGTNTPEDIQNILDVTAGAGITKVAGKIKGIPKLKSSVINEADKIREKGIIKARELGLPDEVIDQPYLVGSRAKGTARDKSDIDILFKTNPEKVGGMNDPKLVELEEYMTDLVKSNKYADWFISPEFDNEFYQKLIDIDLY